MGGFQHSFFAFLGTEYFCNLGSVSDAVWVVPSTVFLHVWKPIIFVTWGLCQMLFGVFPALFFSPSLVDSIIYTVSIVQLVLQ